MSTAARKDPLPAFCFKVSISIKGCQQGEAYFKSIGGLKHENEVVDYKSGGVNNATFKLLGGAKWSNLVLKRGFTASRELLDWREEWLKPYGQKQRATVTVEQLDTQLNTKFTWTFIEGWPCKWELSDLDASKNEIAIETLEIAHHGLQL